jgi:hypothetical protein
MDGDRESGFIEGITPDVLGVLERIHLFQQLDDLFCPQGASNERVKCGHSYAQTETIVRTARMDDEELEEILAVLQSLGGCCDCEILYNVAGESRLKSEYWKARARELLGRAEPESQI